MEGQKDIPWATVLTLLLLPHCGWFLLETIVLLVLLLVLWQGVRLYVMDSQTEPMVDGACIQVHMLDVLQHNLL